MLGFWASGAGSSTGTNLDTIEWQPNTLWSGFQLVPAMTNGDCMLYVVCASTKVASHFIANIDTALGTANPGMSVRYWQPTNSWIAYHNVAGTTGSVTASAASYTASTKILLGVRVSGTALSISVNGAVTTGGTATLFTASRAILNLEASASFVAVYDSFTATGYSETLATRLEGFLAHKHGITLANGHPYRLSPPTLEWVPTDDSGLTIWYDFADASTITVTGAGISDLKNKKNPATYNLTQSTDAQRPSWDGSYATSRGGTTTAGLTTTTTVSWTNAAYLAFAIAKRSSQPAAHNPLVFETTTGGGTHHGLFNQQNTDNWRMRASGAASSSGDTNFGAIAYNTNQLLCVNYDGATTKNGYLNGVLGGTSTTATSASTGTIMHLMRNGDGTTIGDFLVTSSTDTATRQRLEGYLAWKRGLQSSLPSGHPYRTKKPIYQEWTPADSAFLVDWYDSADASTVILSGSDVTSWSSRTGTGNTMTSGATKPTYSNGKIVFNNAAQLTKSSIATGTLTQGNFAIYAVAAHNFGATAYIFNVTDGSAGPGAALRGVTPDDLYVYCDPTTFTAHLVNSGTYIPGADMIFGMISSGSGANTLAGSYNGNITTATGSTTRFTGTNYIVNRSASAAIDSVAEIIILNSSDVALCRKVEGYLAWKRGLASNLPSDHPYRSRPPLTTD